MRRLHTPFAASSITWTVMTPARSFSEDGQLRPTKLSGHIRAPAGLVGDNGRGVSEHLRCESRKNCVDCSEERGGSAELLEPVRLNRKVVRLHGAARYAQEVLPVRPAAFVGAPLRSHRGHEYLEGLRRRHPCPHGRLLPASRQRPVPRRGDSPGPPRPLRSQDSHHRLRLWKPGRGRHGRAALFRLNPRLRLGQLHRLCGGTTRIGSWVRMP